MLRGKTVSVLWQTVEAVFRPVPAGRGLIGTRTLATALATISLAARLSRMLGTGLSMMLVGVPGYPGPIKAPGPAWHHGFRECPAALIWQIRVAGLWRTARAQAGQDASVFTS